MKKQPEVLAAEILPAASLSEPSAEPQTLMAAGDEGLRLIKAFLRIRDPALRATAVDFVSELAGRSQQWNYGDAYFNSLFLFFGAQSVIEGSMSVGKLIAFNMIASQVVQPILRLSQLWQDFQQVQVSVARLGEMSITPMNTSVKTRSSSEVRPWPVRKPRIVSSSRMRAIVCPAARVSKQASGSRKR